MRSLSGTKFDEGLREVQKRYGHTGRLEAGFRTEPKFDDANTRVSFQITVKEGPQYHMGKLIVKGVGDADADLLQQAWKLRPGETFDSSYSERFFKTDAREIVQRINRARQDLGKQHYQIGIEVTPNRQALTADVTLEFKD